MNRYVKSFKVIGEKMYLSNGAVIPLRGGFNPAGPGAVIPIVHGNAYHTSTFVTQTEINASILAHSITFNHLYPIVNYDTNAVLTTADFRKIHMMDVAGGARHFTLPDVGAPEVGEWLIISRKGVTNSLWILAHATDVIFNSDPGGLLECTDPDHDYSSMELIVMDTGVWGNPSFGIWSTR